MTKSTVNETERMVVARIFDAPRELVWKAWTPAHGVALTLGRSSAESLCNSEELTVWSH
jgi:uncharacterized protein YndB with AHSA1/START domain